MKRLILVVLCIAGSAGSAGADARFSEDARIRYVSGTLDALRHMQSTDVSALSSEIHLGARTTCKAGTSDPPVRCLLDMVRKVCAAKPDAQRSACRYVGDVVVTNLLGEKEVVPSKVRFKLMNDADGYRVAMNRHLLSRYAVLAARLSLSRGFDQGKGLAKSIDKFCRVHIRTRRTTWARCVSAIVWYIGTSDHPTTSQDGE